MAGYTAASWSFHCLNRTDLNALRIGGAGHGLWGFLAIVCGVLAFQQVLVLLIDVYVRWRKGPEGEIKMLVGFVRVLAGIGILIAVMYSLGVLKTIGVVAAGFAGMLLGWSLQAPVSGLAAWVLITLMRPFRVSDRVLFPSLGLSGDVKRVGLMYTILDQVGGTIGSEDAIGRDILIPNAMLFSQVAINYTPKAISAYFIDEVVIRMTYDSDWDVAEKIMMDAAREVTTDIIKTTGQEPYIRSDIWDYGILMRLRYHTMAKDRPRITHEIVKKIFQGIQADPRVDVAIPYVYSYRKGSSATERRLFPEPEGKIQEIPIAAIVEPAVTTMDSPEENEKITDLMKDIQERGLLQPIVVSPRAGGYAISVGHQRLQACRRLGWKTIPAIVRP